MIESKIDQIVNAGRDEIIEFLSELIAIPSVNPPGEFYRECVQKIARKLESWNLDHQVINVPLENRDRYSILGSLGSGSKGLHFHGHYDVVPADRPDQFEPLITEEKIFGRGAADMKAGLVSMLYALTVLKRLKVRINGRLTFSIVPDEETGGVLGTDYLFKSGLLPPSGLLGMVMPEPTGGQIWNASRGAFTCRVDIKGRPTHIAQARAGESAFEKMNRVVTRLIGLNREIEGRKTDLMVDPPASANSIMVLGGVAGSGTNFNVVPGRAYFSIDRRFNPEEKLSRVRKEIMEVLNRCKNEGVDLVVEVVQEAEPSYTPEDGKLAQVLESTIMEWLSRKTAFRLCPGCLETRFFYSRGIPALAFGPGLLECAHSAEEYVDISDVLNCAKVYASIGLKLLT
jgi:acetylornithine deacetylase/succinyl-diaminopimelate desuccinylase family protein